MKEYQVQIKETLVKTVTVEAENASHAKEIVDRQWRNQEHILDADNFRGVSFSVPTRQERER